MDPGLKPKSTGGLMSPGPDPWDYNKIHAQLPTTPQAACFLITPYVLLIYNHNIADEIFDIIQICAYPSLSSFTI